MQEEFRSIPNYEGLYEVSNLGNVKSLNYSRTKKEKILTPGGGKYLSVTLCKNKNKKTFRNHILVAIVFLNHTPNGHKIVIDHINGDRFNNRLDNLQIITQRENSSKDQKVGSSIYVGVHWCKARKKWDSKIRINGEKKSLGRFTNEIDASNAYQTALKTLLESTT